MLKQNSKSFLSFFLIAIMCMSLIPISVFAVQTPENAKLFVYEENHIGTIFSVLSYAGDFFDYLFGTAVNLIGVTYADCPSVSASSEINFNVAEIGEKNVFITIYLTSDSTDFVGWRINNGDIIAYNAYAFTARPLGAAYTLFTGKETNPLAALNGFFIEITVDNVAISILQDMSITAVFASQTGQIHLVQSDGGIISENNGIITATPNSGYVFDYWEYTTVENPQDSDWTEDTEHMNAFMVIVVDEGIWYRARFRPTTITKYDSPAYLLATESTDWAGDDEYKIGIRTGFGYDFPVSSVYVGEPADLFLPILTVDGTLPANILIPDNPLGWTGWPFSYELYFGDEPIAAFSGTDYIMGTGSVGLRSVGWAGAVFSLHFYLRSMPDVSSVRLVVTVLDTEGKPVVIEQTYAIATEKLVITDPITVYMSVEKLVVHELTGEGSYYIVEPQEFTIDRSWNAARALGELLKSHDLDFKSTGSLDYSFYLSGVWDSEENSGAGGYLSEFTYGGGSGWMYCVNNYFPQVGASNWSLQSGDVIRWQYTLDMGQDIGGSNAVGGGDIVGLESVNKDALLAKVAEINTMPDKSVWLALGNNQAHYDNAAAVLRTLDATQAEVDAALKLLLPAENDEDIVLADIALSLQMGESGFAVPKQILTVGSDLSERYGYTDAYDGGQVTAFDVFVAAQIVMFGDDPVDVANALAATGSGDVYNVAGMGGGRFVYFVNGVFPSVSAGEFVLQDGDVVEFFAVQDFGWFSDTYAWFEYDGVMVDALSVVVGEEFDLTVTGTWMVISGGWVDVVDGAGVVLVDDATGSFVMPPLAVSGGDGVVTFCFDTVGTYVLGAVDVASEWECPLMSPWLVVTVTESKEPEPVSKTALNVAIAEAELLVEGDYTVESWAVLELVFAEAIEVAGSEDVTQVQVDSVTSALVDAIAGLVSVDVGLVVDKSELYAVLLVADAKVEVDYTLDSWSLFQMVFDDAKTVASNDDATQTEVDSATSALVDAIAGLVPIQSVEVDKSVLTAKLLEAQNKLASVQVGTEPGQYPQAAVTVFENAILAAKSIVDDEAVLQDNVDEAVVVLASAIVVFDEAVIPEPLVVPYQDALEDVLAYIYSTTTNPIVGSIGGEWAVLSMTRYGVEDDAWYEGYLDNLEAYINANAVSIDKSVSPYKVVLHSVKSTDNARVVVALTALGYDVSNWRGYDLLSAYNDVVTSGYYAGQRYVEQQGLNGPVWTLISMDTVGYMTDNVELRAFCLNYLLEHEKLSGGWDLTGSTTGTADPDITGMTLQALAPYYRLGVDGYDALNLGDDAPSYAEIKAVVERAVLALVDAQTETGSFISPFSGESAESASQVLVGLLAVSYADDGVVDSSFIESVLANLLTYYDSTTGGFKHMLSGNVDMMATEQAAYALVAYDRYVNGQTSLYDMSDVSGGDFDPTVTDNAAIAAAKLVVENAFADATVTQTEVDNNEDATLAKVNAILNGLSLNGVMATVEKVSYTVPVAGTEQNPDGIDGRYLFIVTLTKGVGAEQTTETQTLTITATPYDLPIELVSKTTLNTAIADAEALNEDDYTSESWTTLDVALALAIMVADDDTASQAEVDEVTTTLLAAIDTLEPVEEFTVKYVVTFDSDGGSNVNSQTVVEGQFAMRPVDPVKTNFVFLGWFLADMTLDEFDFATPITDDITLMAMWSEDVIVEPVSKAALNVAIVDAEALNEDDYTEESWTMLEMVLADALMIAADEDALQTEVNNVTSALLAAIEGLKLIEEPVGETFTVSFRLIGDTEHSATEAPQYYDWIATREITIEVPASGMVYVYDVFMKAINEAGLTQVGADNNYVSSITNIDGVRLGEFDNGSPNSGWKYLQNGYYPGSGLKEYLVSNGDVIVWHFINDYVVEDSVWVDAWPNIPVLTGISVTTMPIKTVYTVGERLSLNGLVVTAFYEDGVTSEFGRQGASASFSPSHNAVLNTEGTVAVMVTYQGMTTTFDITVVGIELPEIVDKTALIFVIADAQDKFDSAQIGTELGQYPQVAVTALENAIVEAQAIVDKVDVSQSQVSSAVTALANALVVFEAAKISEVIFEPPTVTYQDAFDDVLSFVRLQVPSPQIDSVGGEWAVIALNRGGITDIAWNSAYLDTLEAFLRDSGNVYSYDSVTGIVKIHSVKITENERVILALTSMGVNASNFRGFDLVSALLEKDGSGEYKLAAQGVNGVIFALIALDSGDYLDNAEGVALRQWCIEYLLDCQKTNGGWDLLGSLSGYADADITGMALQALAPYYASNAQVKVAVEKAVYALQDTQEADGSFSYGSEGKSSESTVQVLVALTALGYDGTSDGSFLFSVIENLLTYRDESSGGFKHTMSGSVDQMASEQAAYALVAYDRYVSGKNSLYDMSDIELVVDDNVNTDPVSDVVVEDLENGTGIFVTAKPGVLSSGVELEVIPWMSGAAYDMVEEVLKDLDVQFLLFGITLLKNNEEIHSFGGAKIVVSIPVPEGYDGAECKVYYVDATGDVVDMKAELIDGYLVFDTDHLSLYAVVQSIDSNSNTGGNTDDDNSNSNTGGNTNNGGSNQNSGNNNTNNGGSSTNNGVDVNNGGSNLNTDDDVNSGDDVAKNSDDVVGGMNMWLWIGGVSLLIVVLGVVLFSRYRKKQGEVVMV